MVSFPDNSGEPGNWLTGVIGCDGGLRGSPIGIRKIAQILPNGRLLVIALPIEQVRLRNYGEHLNQVMEIDWTAYAYWANNLGTEHDMVNGLRLLEHLHDGRTHIVARRDGGHCFLDRTGAMTRTVGERSWLEPGEFSQKPERPLGGKAALRFGHRLQIDPQLNRLLEFD